MNSNAQVTTVGGESGTNRHRKNSRNPIIRKDEIIPNNTDVWNYPSPGTAQVLTDANNAKITGVISRYGDNSNSLINEQLRQQDLKALKKLASEE